ncbi:hypothetical protein GUITHDRAFT_105653 [Guillardia theta CCMP2712]|uniref:Peptidase A1 domain-containing protein n=1 Tax=Guillardia theta (strain CCMP2712) TaxID=905079 RepID=L1JJL1_GUITC|nr:hypothetical protein GUITHDRAFT_105653 [Guillardia theta CCMP2712]EKX48507.1 hypothetical protein GUITHDRAFT_105653 [Guillardia theta CCMP2712]|eukprot:XP_005835487.1 hypothetical protein GUITHDRAFT_105653 [Guillardia theta CCMP2712]
MPLNEMRWKVACLFLMAAATCHAGQVVDVDGGSTVFMMNTTNPFHPSKSLSFAHVLFVGFDLTYADTAGLRGYIAQDIAQLGRYYAKTKFGCITQCDSQDFNGIDGILGLGMPDAALASIPEPLFFAISDETGDPANQYILNRRIFTLVSTDEAAELHLGGYDPHAVTEDMKYFRTTSQAEYSVPVSSISMGGHEFLNFASAAQAKGRTSIPGILDSGTSCLVVPDSTLDGLFLESPYQRFMNYMQRGLSIYITVADHQGVLLGDALFRSLVVLFDLTHPLTCSHVNDFKGCVAESHPRRFSKMRLAKKRGRGQGSPYLRKATKQLAWLQKKAMSKVPVDFYEQTQFFVNVSLGTPRQTRTVILDTGSSVFGVFCDPPPKRGEATNSHIYLPHFIPASFLQTGVSVSRKVSPEHEEGVESLTAVVALLVIANVVMFMLRTSRRREQDSVTPRGFEEA